MDHLISCGWPAERHGLTDSIVCWQAGSVDNSTATYEVPIAGQPLFLHYQPEKLARGLPAAVISWFASDLYGKTSEVSRISIDISCDPGHAISSEDPTTCVACQPGQYNLPELLDQVWLLCLTHR